MVKRGSDAAGRSRVMASIHDQLGRVVETLTARCTALGCAVWQVSGDPPRVSELVAPPGTGRWLESDLVTRHITEAAAHSVDSDNQAPTTIFPGAWLIPLAIGDPRQTTTKLMVLAFDGDDLHAADLEPYCTVAGMSVEEARLALAPLTRRRQPSPHDLQQMLRWTVSDLMQTSLDARAIDEFSEKLIQSYEESNFLYRLARLLKWSASPTVTIEMSCHQIYEIMPFDWVVARFIDDTSVKELAGKLIVAGQLPCDVETFDQYTSSLMTGWSPSDWTTLLTPDNSDLAALSGGEVVAEPITNDNRVVGLLLAGGKQGNDLEIGSHETQFFDASADFLGVFHENLSRFEEQKSMFLGTLQALTASIDAKDEYTCGHSERVALLGSQLAAAIGLDAGQVEQVRIAGLVHDVGKIGIAESVLSKPGKLTQEEFEQIKQHPVIGHQILKDIPPLAAMLPGVLYHHERWDGRGYPEGLGGENIPLYGRLLAYADTFDAMSSTRAYRPAMPREKVLAELKSCAGSQFDPAMSEAFANLDFRPYDAMVDRHSTTSSCAA